jgi:predicted alpha-1,6-mannanase (GH76 family)
MVQAPTIRLISFLTLGLLSGCAASRVRNDQSAPALTAAGVAYLQDSKDAAQTLQTWYEPSTGLYRTTGWWNSANAITVLVDFERMSKSTQYNSILTNTFTAAQKTSPGFLNKYYDDEGWWALAWIDAYDLTRNKDYLSMAESIFADMAASWDDTCGGGIWWSKDKNYKNAIANELFLSVAAHLANRTSGSARRRYLEWGDREWKWFEASGMINDKGLINDGLGNGRGHNAGQACTNNGRTTWTYNQGVVLGGLAELSAANHDPALAEAAEKIATVAITQLVDEYGILHDPCEPKCGADGVQFKGIFVRNLVLLDRTHPQKAYESFIDKNADTLWKDAQGPGFHLSERWSGPFDSGNAASQTSALDVLVGAALLHTEGPASRPVGKRTLAEEPQHALAIDATKQFAPPRGRGPFPGSALPGHSTGFPIRLDLIATGKREPDGTSLIDFMITNIGAEPIKLPLSLDGNISSPRTILALYFTSDAIEYGHLVGGAPILPFQPISAELYAQSGDLKSFDSLAPGKTLRVHASTVFELKPGRHSLTAHAELSREVVTPSGVGSEVLGTAESIPVKKTFSAQNFVAR